MIELAATKITVEILTNNYLHKFELTSRQVRRLPMTNKNKASVTLGLTVPLTEAPQMGLGPAKKKMGPSPLLFVGSMTVPPFL